MKKILLIALLSSFVCGHLSARKYRVYFKDKAENLEMMAAPYTFLSAKAIARRATHNIPLTVSDLPVSQSYVQEIAQRGYEVKFCSRWFNYALVEGQDAAVLAELPFVKRVEKVENYRLEIAGTGSVQATQLTYGLAANQVEMLNGDFLHDLGYTGQGMTIAVLDAGFQGAPALKGLDSLRQSGRLLGTKNYVEGGTNVYQGGGHGTYVLSIMAGYITDTFAGSAVGASYWLLKTEDESSETPVEMDNWLRAAEFADSAGADMITSSLGYSKFDGGVGDYDISDLDGNTILVTRAADMAAAKGMLVVVSAGNEGNDSWKRITAPADGDSVLAVGAVGPDGNYASFSSQGPTADGRIKPDVVAQGLATAYLSLAGPSLGNGTSFSCPVVSGMAACLWSAYPAQSNVDIFNAIKYNASERFTPTMTKGFGLPNFRDASWELTASSPGYEKLEVSVYPNPVGDDFSVEIIGIDANTEVELGLFDMSGKLIHQFVAIAQNRTAIPVTHHLQSGSYMMSLRLGDQVYLKKIIK